jgi:uncharacterized Zn-binding protein involved in type VI secretion
MGMPACRIGDLTEHGGTIMVGFPTVLIGEMPASRIGDMHVCPMVTPGVPPIPHVGGPFVLGSPTVIVGMMPQSRVTDMLICVGPPDQAVLGCMTVLVGMAGGAGAAGAGAGAAAIGVPVHTSPAPGSSDDAAGSTQPAQTKATRTPDGSIQTASTVPGKPLPPMTLKQIGWPDLPPENTATFSSVQPATILPGTQLYAAGDGQDPGSNSYWTTTPPSNDPSQSDPSQDPSQGDPSSSDPSQNSNPAPATNPYLSSSEATAALNTATHVAVLAVTSPQGLKAWAGTAAGTARNSAANAAPGLLVYAPPAAAQAAATIQQFRMPPRPGSR